MNKSTNNKWIVILMIAAVLMLMVVVFLFFFMGSASTDPDDDAQLRNPTVVSTTVPRVPSVNPTTVITTRPTTQPTTRPMTKPTTRPTTKPSFDVNQGSEYVDPCTQGHHTYEGTGFCIYCAHPNPGYDPCAKGHTYEGTGFCVYCAHPNPDFDPCAKGHIYENGYCIYCLKKDPTATTPPTTKPTTKPTTTSTTKPTTVPTTQPTTAPKPAPTYPYVSGTFMQPGAFAGYDVARMTVHLQYLKEIGVELLIVQNIFDYNGKVTKSYFQDSFAANQLADTYNRNTVGFLDVVLSAAKACDMEVYIGLTNDGNWWKKVFNDEAWLKDHVNISVQAARQIYDRYKSKYPDTLTGWYFWPEYWNMDCTNQQILLGAQFLSDYRDGLAAIDGTMPMLLSPFVTPAVDTAKTQDFWTQIILGSTLRSGDIFCCQDAVGAGHTTLDQLDGYFAAMKAAVSVKPGLKFWANNEDFTKDYKSADMERFKQQLEITHKYADTHISFAFCHYRNPDTGKVNEYNAYKYYYETGELQK